MHYSIIITKNTERHIDNILNYLCNTLNNYQAARGLLSEIEHVYNNLEKMPEMYPYMKQPILKLKEYQKAMILHYNYVMIFRVDRNEKKVYILGIFHELEDYIDKL